MIIPLTARLLREVDPAILWNVITNLGLKNLVNVLRFRKRQREQRPFFPGFMILSLTTRCNLHCEGCWVSSETRQDMPLAMARDIVGTCLARGSAYFGLVGGEPLLYPWLFDLIAEFPGAFFQVFTNGTLLTSEVADRFRRLGNVTPLISIEGLAEESDRRRHGSGVFAAAMTAVAHCRASRLLTGVASSVCATNIDHLVTDSFVREITARGAHYLWYYIYRPVGPRPHPERALNDEQILRLRRFIVEARLVHPIGIIDTYWDADGRALCPGAMGLSHHIGPEGHLEFCPPLQFAFDRLGPGDRFGTLVRQAGKLGCLRERVAGATRGCILLNDPHRLHAWLTEMQAVDSSGRATAFSELALLNPVPCHHLPGREIPEKSWVYRLAKKFAFFGFGAYG
jgi:MoaA/NifB/PqqE/SkfB family radical SAM enzyme